MTQCLHSVCTMFLHEVQTINLVPPQLVLQFLQTLSHFLQSRLQTAGVAHLRASFVHIPHLQKSVSETTHTDLDTTLEHSANREYYAQFRNITKGEE